MASSCEFPKNCEGVKFAFISTVLMESPHNELTGEVIATAIEVHRALGPGLLESVYLECLQLELTHRSFRFATQVAIPVTYKGFALGAANFSEEKGDNRNGKAFCERFVLRIVRATISVAPFLLLIRFLRVLRYLRTAIARFPTVGRAPPAARHRRSSAGHWRRRR